MAVGLVEKDKILLKKEMDFNEKDRCEITKIIEERIVQFVNEILTKEKIELSKIESIGIAVPR